MRALRIAAAVMLATGVSHAAMAADTAPLLPVKAPPPPNPVFSWTGFYLGGNIGGGKSNIDFSGSATSTSAGAATPFSFAHSGTASGAFGGGQVGFNYELPTKFVVGIEADVDGAALNGLTSYCSTATGGPLAGHFANCVTNNNKLNDFGSVRGRFGYAFNNVLLYGTGGFAWGEGSTNSATTCVAGPGFPCPRVGAKFTGGSSASSDTFGGWAAGGGIEWQVVPHWILRAEYLHLQFDGAGENFSTSGTASKVPFATTGRTSSDIGVDIGRVGLTYLFDPAWRLDSIWNPPQPNPSTQSAKGLAAFAPGAEANAFSDFLNAWHSLAEQVRANQPAWSSPLITTTGMLEQRYRFDASEQHAGNGNATTVLDGGKGLDLIVSNSNEIQIAAPPYDIRDTPTGKSSFQGFGDWAFLRVKQQLASAPASGGDYFVTAWLQIQAPTGIGPLTNNAWTYIPTLAFGKGWGDFDIQATVAGVLPASNVSTLGDQIQTNVAFQYHLMKVLWPEFEVNWTYWANGQRGGLNQVFLTPGLVIGRFPLANGILFTTGFGYQIAVSPSYRPSPLTPAYGNAWVFTSRFNF
jgi:opacity protein-like surface antigen